MTAAAGAVRKVVAIAAVGMKRLLRDRSYIFFLLLFPLLLVLVLGSVFGSGFRPSVGVVAPTDDALAQEIVASLDEGDLRVVRYESEGSLRSAVERGTAQAGVVIPEDFSHRLSSSEVVEVGFVARPTGFGQQLQPIVASAVGEQAVVVQAAQFLAEHGGTGFEAGLDQANELYLPDHPVGSRTVDVGDTEFPDSLGQYDLGASSMLLLFVFVNGLASSTVLIQSRQLGVSRRMFSTPTSTRVLLLGETFGRLFVTLFQGVYIMVATSLLFGVQWGNLVASLMLVFVFSLVAGGAAMLVGSTLSNDQQAGSIGVVAGLGLAALGGSMAPLEVFSPTMRSIAHITPHAWGNEAFATLVRHDGGVVDILPELGVLAAMAAALTALAVWRLRVALTAP